MDKKFHLAQKFANLHGGSLESLQWESPLKWKCYEGHTWSKKFTEQKSRINFCKQCSNAVSKYEEISRMIIENIFNNEYKFPNSRPKWLNKLELDGYNEELSLAFEYQGEQHYEDVKYFRTISFEKRLENDTNKRLLCQEQNVFLIVIPYWIRDVSKLQNFIYDYIPNILPKNERNELMSIDDIMNKLVGYYSKHINEQILYYCQLKGYKLIKQNTILKSDFNKNIVECVDKCHETTQTYSQLRDGRHCVRCSRKDFQKIKLRSINRGFTILNEYEPLDNELFEYRCNICNYIFTSDAYKHYNCFKCSCLANRRVNLNTSENIYLYASFVNFTVELNNDLSGIHKWTCNLGHSKEKTLHNFKRRAYKCTQCRIDKNKWFLINKVQNHGLYHIEGNFEDLKQTITWKCNQNHIINESYQTIKNYIKTHDCACKICYKNKNIIILNQKYLQYRIRFIDNEYKKLHDPVKWECFDKKHITIKSRESMQTYIHTTGKSCSDCSKDDIITKNNIERLIDFKRDISVFNLLCISNYYNSRDPQQKLEFVCTKNHKTFLSMKIMSRRMIKCKQSKFSYPLCEYCRKN